MSTKTSAKKELATDKLTPKQAAALERYINPSSPTFGNVRGSFIAAGFSESYADNVLAVKPAWLMGFIGNHDAMLAKAERNLEEFLDLDARVPAMGAFGPLLDPKTKRPILVVNTKLLSLRQDTSKFVAERLGRKRFGIKPDEGPPPGTLIQNFTQINIHPPAP